MKKTPHSTNASETSADSPKTPGVEASALGTVEQPTAEDASAALVQRIAVLEESVLRAKADYQNLQRRALQERSDAVRYANAELMRSLLGVMDDLERALSSAETPEGLAALRDGARLVRDNLLKALESNGLEMIDPLHQPFDPHIHEALMHQPSPDHPDGTVIQALAKGYRLRERTLRPAKVIVVKNPPAGPGKGDGEEVAS